MGAGRFTTCPWSVLHNMHIETFILSLGFPHHSLLTCCCLSNGSGDCNQFAGWLWRSQVWKQWRSWLLVSFVQIGWPIWLLVVDPWFSGVIYILIVCWLAGIRYWKSVDEFRRWLVYAAPSVHCWVLLCCMPVSQSQVHLADLVISSCFILWSWWRLHILMPCICRY
jgi:hypothetical protein